MTALKKITTRAKQLQRMHKSWTWMQCIKKASAEYRQKSKPKTSSRSKKGKISAVKFIEHGETRKTPAKKVYRVQRSKKGLYAGVKAVGSTSNYNNVILERLRSTNNALQSAQRVLEQKKSTYKKMEKGFLKNVSRRGIADQKKLISTLRKELTMIKALLK